MSPEDNKQWKLCNKDGEQGGCPQLKHANRTTWYQAFVSQMASAPNAETFPQEMWS